MSFAPKDGHENQIQFALERGIGAMISVLATKQLPYPKSSFEMVHCSRCRVDWHENDGILLKEVDRVLRPNGYFVYSAPPAYKKEKNYPIIWEKLINITTAMCWKLIAQQVQTAIWLKQENDTCRLQNKEQNLLTICEDTDDKIPSWKANLSNCVKLSSVQNNQKLPPRPDRLSVYSGSLEKLGVTPQQFDQNNKFWQEQVSHYWKLIGVNKMEIRNVMDMNAYYGGFSVALSTFPVWVMNVVPTTTSNTLSAIYDRGLIGVFHDWCEPFSTYPRTYDLLHAFHLFSNYNGREEGCSIEDIMLEMDRMIRPQGTIIIRDEDSFVSRIKEIAPKFLWDVTSHMLENEERVMEPVLICKKKFWAII
ncbi:putative methyltransferase PMT7 [Iris pallida]|nr:putative methyltransferase PMT7 [Iris pallida]